MNNDFDMERSQASVSEAENEPRVSIDDGVNVKGKEEREDDSNMNSEIRVSNLDSKNDDIEAGRGDVRDLGTSRCLNGDSGNLVRLQGSSEDNDDDDDDADDPDSDVGLDFRVQDRQPRVLQTEIVTPELGVVSDSDDQIGEKENLGSINDFGAVDDGMNRKKVITNSDMSEIDGDFTLERRNDPEALASSSFSASEVNGMLIAGSVKVPGSQFEMGEMVWGRVKSHPWWPGHIYNEALASSSVRHTRRDGLVLVAFFGDSSYGWFDPMELVPYEPHYAEKSQQTNSKSFMWAVEESVDEVSRRSALGLSCYCRNPSNFRPVSVPNYLAVDVFDYDPSAIYSVNQIEKARESFHPAEALSFITDLAVAPRSCDSKSLDFIKQKATSLAYRRYIYEEFDETYAQAFGEQPERPSQSSTARTKKGASRAPLSGPLVFAETVGGRMKGTKSKDSSKKDRYLFKRRDEAAEIRTNHTSQIHASSSSSSAYEDGAFDPAAASYVFQKRDQGMSANVEMAAALSMDQTVNSVHSLNAKDSPPSGIDATIIVEAHANRAPFDDAMDSQNPDSSVVSTTKAREISQVPDAHISPEASANPGQIGMGSDLMKKKKKKKAAKRAAGEQNTEKSDQPEKKKRKKKKTDSERSMEEPNIGVSSGENSEISHMRKDTEVSYSVSQLMGSVALDEADVLQILTDLRDLAIDPRHYFEINVPAIMWQFFLKYRSRVFLKSSTGSSPTDSVPSEARATKSTHSVESPGENNTKSVPSLKPSKLSARHKVTTKGGTKRASSDSKEETATKKAKKVTEAKTSGTEKKTSIKNPEKQQPNGKTKAGGPQQLQPKSTKPLQHTKRVDRPPRVEEPTYLVMKFQSGSSLPSLVELKARFARFGPLDTSLSRVFYKTNTCRVAFLYKQDANVAYRYAVGNKSVFSNVKFMLKPVAAPETQPPSSNRPGDGEAANRDSPAIEPRPLIQQLVVKPLKSCLKKTSEGESGAPTKATRVRFNLGEDKGDGSSSSNRRVIGFQEQQMECRNALKLQSQSSSEGCSSSSSFVGMDVVSKDQRFISTLPLQVPSLPPQIHRPHIDLNHNLGSTTGLSSSHIEFSQQMMRLLTRCHDVVTNIKSILGYVPYHTL